MNTATTTEATKNEFTLKFKVGDSVETTRGMGGRIVGYETHDFTGRRTYLVRFWETGLGGGYDDYTLIRG